MKFTGWPTLTLLMSASLTSASISSWVDIMMIPNCVAVDVPEATAPPPVHIPGLPVIVAMYPSKGATMLELVKLF